MVFVRSGFVRSDFCENWNREKWKYLEEILWKYLEKWKLLQWEVELFYCKKWKCEKWLNSGSKNAALKFWARLIVWVVVYLYWCGNLIERASTTEVIRRAQNSRATFFYPEFNSIFIKQVIKNLWPKMFSMASGLLKKVCFWQKEIFSVLPLYVIITTNVTYALLDLTNIVFFIRHYKKYV